MNRLILLICLFISHTLYGQEAHVIEPAVLECRYDHTLQLDTLNPDQKLRDLMVLRIGEKTSEFFSYYKQQDDSIEYDPNCAELRKELFFKRFNNLDSTRRAGTISTYDYIYKNYPKGKYTTYSSLGSGNRGKYIVITEEIPMMQWTLTDSTKTIYGYKCQKATTNFRGRTYIAWFTHKLSFNNGPWKLGGLKGLILEAYDQEKHYHYIIKEIKTKKISPVTFYNYGKFNHEAMDRKEYLREHYERISAYPITFRNTEHGYDLMERDYR